MGSVQKVENETFNTLKNQGYQLEHNFGHGKQFLSSVLACLMMLAFLTDQLAQRSMQMPVSKKPWPIVRPEKTSLKRSDRSSIFYPVCQ